MKKEVIAAIQEVADVLTEARRSVKAADPGYLRGDAAELERRSEVLAKLIRSHADELEDETANQKW